MNLRQLLVRHHMSPSEFIATKRDYPPWSDDIDPDSEATWYGVAFDDLDEGGLRAAARAVEDFRRRKNIRAGSPVAVFGPFDGKCFMLGQV